MFNQLFFRADALTRQLSAPLVDERCQYLAQCASQGMSKDTLRMKARVLLSIVKHLRLGRRPKDVISISEIKDAASRWSHHNWSTAKTGHAKQSRQCFITDATAWLTSLNRLQIVPKPVTAYDPLLAEFRTFMKEDRGLSPTTVEYRCGSVRPFLDRLFEKKRSLKTITASDIDSLLAEKVFLTMHAPICPLSNGAMWAIVSHRLRKRAPALKHHGPHSIRHACATRLINQGLSLKEIGDHLGQRDPEATRIYAKVDLVRLREVATFDLGGLL